MVTIRHCERFSRRPAAHQRPALDMGSNLRVGQQEIASSQTALLAMTI
jgi:hypothetical protein